MGSVHPLYVFFQCFGLRGAWFAAFWDKTLLVLTTLPVTDRAPFLDSSSPTLPLPCWSLCQQRSVGDGTIMQVPAPDHLSLALTLRDRVVLGYHVSAIEGRFFPLEIPSALLRGIVITLWLKEEGMTFLKLQREAGGKKGTLLVLPTSRAVRGEGEDVRGLLMAKEGWKRTCPLGTTSPVPRCCVSLCGSTKHCSGPVQQNPAGPVAPMGWTSTQPGWGCREKSWRRRAGEGLKIVPFLFCSCHSWRTSQPEASQLPYTLRLT